jgi:hypothetical protein
VKNGLVRQTFELLGWLEEPKHELDTARIRLHQLARQKRLQNKTKQRFASWARYQSKKQGNWCSNLEICSQSKLPRGNDAAVHVSQRLFVGQFG